jgi:hypothetical protein
MPQNKTLGWHDRGIPGLDQRETWGTSGNQRFLVL